VFRKKSRKEESGLASEGEDKLKGGRERWREGGRGRTNCIFSHHRLPRRCVCRDKDILAPL